MGGGVKGVGGSCGGTRTAGIGARISWRVGWSVVIGCCWGAGGVWIWCRCGWGALGWGDWAGSFCRGGLGDNQTDTEFRGVCTEFHGRVCVRASRRRDDTNTRKQAWRNECAQRDFNLSVKLRANSSKLRVNLIAVPPHTMNRNGWHGRRPACRNRDWSNRTRVGLMVRTGLGRVVSSGWPWSPPKSPSRPRSLG